MTILGKDMPDEVTVNDNGDSFSLLVPLGFTSPGDGSQHAGALFSGKLSADIPDEKNEHFRKAKAEVVQPGLEHQDIVWSYKFMPRGSGRYDYGFTLWTGTTSETEFIVHKCRSVVNDA
ncbi:hypothetical protein [Enterobacter roggenkampii]|uniref:hypothetical protein n=1 Tax=Enterobacter roggenkampii TaxID=1812935 RepID=UPI00321934AF